MRTRKYVYTLYRLENDLFENQSNHMRAKGLLISKGIESSTEPNLETGSLDLHTVCLNVVQSQFVEGLIEHLGGTLKTIIDLDTGERRDYTGLNSQRIEN